MATYTGIGAAFGSFFGSSDLEDAYAQAIRELEKFRTTADESLQGFRTKGQGLYDKAISNLANPEMAPDLKALRSMLMTNISSGLSPLAKLYMEDANRYLEGRAISTGNLRSGAVGIQRGELGRRVVADEFGRALTTLNTLRQGDIASTQMYLGGALGYAQNENVALNTLGNAVQNLSGAQIGKGVVDYNKAVALGTAVGGLFDKGEEYAMTYFSGGTNTGSQGPDNSGGNWIKNMFTGT